MHSKSYILLSNKLKNRKHNIGIIGLGYVGLPLVKRFLKSGCKKIFGVDSDENKVKLLQRGISPIDSIDIKYFKNNKEQVSTNYSILNSADIIFICLPTPLKSKDTPDLKYLVNCYKNLSKIDLKDKIIILESTVYPGVTRKLANKLVLKNNLFIIGKNIFFGYSPERENPGDKSFTYKKTPKVISGYTKNCSKLIKKIYSSIAKKIFNCNTIEEAETSKLLENLYRSINIGLANEMKLICDKLKINVHSVIDAAATKNFGFQKFIPGPGLGGHCIPIDPYYLSWISEKKGYEPKLLKSAAKINNSMPRIIINKILSHFDKKPKILIFGVSYKKNVDDDRESQSFEFIKILKKRRINFDYFDPYFPKIKKGRKTSIEKKSIKLNLKNVKNYDCAIIITDHDLYNYDFIKKNFRYVFDARGVFFRKKIVSQNIIQV
jgi:UDP-N-acetyl-D-glucosamine dehydrogenase